MKEYTHYNALELAQVEDFILWVEHGGKNKALDDWWNAWLMNNPGKREVVDDARRIVTAVISEKQYFLHDSKQQEIWSRIEGSTSEVRPLGVSRFYRYSIAASLALIVAACLYFFQFDPKTSDGKTIVKGEDLLSLSNESNKPHKLLLEDGSVVILQPNSVIEYPATFSATHRMVRLKGEAFFEIARDTERPFSVFASDIVTRVLGTSFTIRAYKDEKEITVSVRTGKVSVLRESEMDLKNTSSKILSGILLTPNQKIIYSKEEERMVKSLVDQPVALPSIVTKDNFRFEDTPISEVFDRLEKAYGVDIIFDSDEMSNCFLNASLEDISFYDKLRLICKGVNAKYEMLDAHIIITGGGCN